MAERIRGFAFPFRIDPLTGSVATVDDRQKIRQNVVQILATRLGERPMLRGFGSRLPALVHDPNSDTLAAVAEGQAREALQQWEPRVLVTNTRIERDEGVFKLHIEYIYINRGDADSLSFPIG